MSPTDVSLPRLGERMVEATVVAYRVTPQQRVTAGQVLLVVEHQGALAEIPAPLAGRVEALLVHEGATVPAGTALVRLSELKGPKPVELGGPPRISPAVRKLAREYGIDLHAVQGSGQEGRVTRTDVERAVAVTPADRPVEVVPQAAPNFVSPGVLFYDLELSTVDRWIAADRADARSAQLELTAWPYLLSAIARALVDQPELNATSFDHRLIKRSDRHLSVGFEALAKAAVIHRADQLPLLALASTLAALRQRAERGTLTAADQAPSAFSVALGEGHLGIGTSGLRSPEVANLRLSAIRRQPWAVNHQGVEQVVVLPVVTAALNFDPRFVSPSVASAFLGRIDAKLRTR
ncbi:MAG: E3 binding domain-containing protein [Deltaproteobacteria bacterium]|nr:E3 binding domain-containing protein [Deltaproteobacteria bacterium]